MTLETLRACGIHAAVITYDPRETLRAFGEAYHIAYPLLSDVGSQVIRAFGILNTNIPEDRAMMYGIPWPGNYLIAPDGKVLDKEFLPDYQRRPSAAAVLLRHFGDTVGRKGMEITTDVLQATLTLSTDHCFPGQDIAVALRLRVTPGWHVYGAPVPTQYQGLALVIESPIVESLTLAWPPPTPLLLAAVGETLPVYTGEIEALGTLRVKWSPPMPAPFLEALGARMDPGRYMLNGVLRFQACRDELCATPQAVAFTVPLQIEAGIPPAPKQPQ
jgi:hypothetical protein